MQRASLKAHALAGHQLDFPIVRDMFLALHKMNKKGMLTRVLWVPAHVSGGGNEAADFGEADGKWQPAQLWVTLEKPKQI